MQHGSLVECIVHFLRVFSGQRLVEFLKVFSSFGHVEVFIPRFEVHGLCLRVYR